VGLDTWLDSVHEKGRDIFYTTLKEQITNHPKKDLLTETEIVKIMDVEKSHDRLYELLINVFYQKDEPVFRSLLENGDKGARSRFQNMYLELAEFSADMFIESFFYNRTGEAVV
jgi:hypothetical protein